MSFASKAASGGNAHSSASAYFASSTVSRHRASRDSRRRSLVYVAGLEVAAQHVATTQHLGTVADQVHTLERRGQLAVLDQVALRQREHEVTVGDVDLAAAEALGVDAALDALDDVLGSGGAAEQR